MRFCHPRETPVAGLAHGVARAWRLTKIRWLWAAILMALGLAAGWPFSVFAQVQAPKPVASSKPVPVEMDVNYGVGAWIWASETHDQQMCRFWRAFEIPNSSRVVKARLRMTVDDSYRLFLDGRELGRGGQWRDFTDYDLSLLLEPGLHVLAVEGFNYFSGAGVLAGLQVELADGSKIEIASDASWKVAPDTEDNWKNIKHAPRTWPAATVVRPFRKAGQRTAGPLIRLAPQLLPIVVRFWQTGVFQIALLSLCSLVALACLWLISRLALKSQAQQVMQRERARIARDIHDDLTAGLTQLVLLGEAAQTELPDGPELRQYLGQVCEKSHSLSRSMNEIIWAVNSQRDTLRDFVSHVCKYTETYLQPTPIRCRFDLEEEMPDLPCELGVRRNLFLAVKEALHNVIRHSDATEVVVRMRRRGPHVFVAVEDNGRGFEPDLTDGAGNGLSNMAKRAAESGGSCVVISQPGAGCRVEFSAPLAGRKPHPFRWLGRFWKRPVAARRTSWPVDAVRDQRPEWTP